MKNLKKVVLVVAVMCLIGAGVILSTKEAKAVEHMGYCRYDKVYHICDRMASASFAECYCYIEE